MPNSISALAAKDAFCSQLLSKRLFGDLHYVLRDYKDFSTCFVFRRKSQVHHFSKFFSPMRLVTDREKPPKNYFTFVEYVSNANRIPTKDLITQVFERIAVVNQQVLSHRYKSWRKCIKLQLCQGGQKSKATPAFISAEICFWWCFDVVGWGCWQWRWWMVLWLRLEHLLWHCAGAVLVLWLWRCRVHSFCFSVCHKYPVFQPCTRSSRQHGI